MRWLWKFMLKLTGWKVDETFPHHLPRYIILVAPHTSSWDFVLGLGVRSVVRLGHVKFLAKAELFTWPFGAFFRWLGGYPVYRSGKHNMVSQVVELFQQQEKFAVVIAPEGTRKRVNQLKTGFYHIAREANVPIVLAAFDFGNKRVFFSDPLYLTHDQEADMANILDFYTPVMGCKPGNDLTHLRS